MPAFPTADGEPTHDTAGVDSSAYYTPEPVVASDDPDAVAPPAIPFEAAAAAADADDDAAGGDDATCAGGEDASGETRQSAKAEAARSDAMTEVDGELRRLRSWRARRAAESAATTAGDARLDGAGPTAADSALAAADAAWRSAPATLREDDDDGAGFGDAGEDDDWELEPMPETAAERHLVAWNDELNAVLSKMDNLQSGFQSRDLVPRKPA